MSRSKWKIAELVFTGNELLNGRVLNTNSQWIAQALASLGIQVKRMAVVEDNVNIIAEELRESLGREPDLIIVSGGLGPTYDDVTLEGIAKALGDTLQLNQVALKMIQERYLLAEKAGLLKVKDSERLMIKMATLPASCTPLANPAGAAPGVMVERGKTAIFSLPGVPVEMKSIFNSAMIPWLRSHFGNAYHADATILVSGLGESRLGPIIERAMSEIPDTWIKSCVQSAGRSEICISTTATSQEEADRRIHDASKMIIDRARDIGGSTKE